MLDRGTGAVTHLSSASRIRDQRAHSLCQEFSGVVRIEPSVLAVPHQIEGPSHGRRDHRDS
jgi:hypothetical protein